MTIMEQVESHPAPPANQNASNEQPPSPTQGEGGVAEVVKERPECVKLLHRPKLPDRPLQPLRAYIRYSTEFLHDKIANKGAEKLDYKAMFVQAGQQWNAFSAEEKSKYFNSARSDWEEYFKALTTWKQLKEELKRPAGPYALFLQDIWEEERKRRANGDQPRKFVDVSRHASDLWNHAAYKRRYEEAKLKYNEKMRRLSEEKIGTPVQDAPKPNDQAAREREEEDALMDFEEDTQEKLGQGGMSEIYKNQSVQSAQSTSSVSDMDFREQDLNSPTSSDKDLSLSRGSLAGVENSTSTMSFAVPQLPSNNFKPSDDDEAEE